MTSVTHSVIHGVEYTFAGELQYNTCRSV